MEARMPRTMRTMSPDVFAKGLKRFSQLMKSVADDQLNNFLQILLCDHDQMMTSIHETYNHAPNGTEQARTALFQMKANHQ